MDEKGFDIAKLSRRKREELFKAVKERERLGEKYGKPGLDAGAGEVQKVVAKIKKGR